jgi:four helix bundle protein
MLRIYEVAIALIRDARGIVEAIERRDVALGRQTRDALSSIALNLAEGAGNVGGHKRQRFQTALGSAREVKGCFDVASAHGYIEAVDARLLDKLAHVTATLVRLVNGRR